MGTTRDTGNDDPAGHLTHECSGDESVSDAVVTAVAAETDEPRDSLPPIERSVNPDALDVLFDPAEDTGRSTGCVTFSYYGHVVVVQSSGLILVRQK